MVQHAVQPSGLSCISASAKTTKLKLPEDLSSSILVSKWNILQLTHKLLHSSFSNMQKKLKISLSEDTSSLEASKHFRRHTFCLVFFCHILSKGTPGYAFKLFWKENLQMNRQVCVRSINLISTPQASPRNSSSVQEDSSYGCLSSPSSSPSLFAVLPEMRSCWQCLCNNRWKLEINTSCLSRYSPLSIYF